MPDENPAGNCCTATHCSSPVQSVIGRCACVQETAAAMVATKNEPPQEQEEDDQVVVLTEMVVPPDGGWGWVIVFASFFCNLFIDGIIFSFGMFLNEIADAFQCTKAEVSIVGSLLTGFYLIVGPFVSALANRFGFRAVAMLGSALGCIGFGLSFYATNLMFLYITFGVIGGIGFGLVYVPAVIAVGFYFERWRALATGIGVCGSGIGTFVLAPLVAMMIPTYGWRGTVLILAGLILNCAVFGALFRPLAPIKVVVSKQEVEEQAATVEALQEKVTMNGNGTVGHEDIPLLMRIKIARDEMRKSDSLTSVRLVNEPSSPNMKNGHLRMNNNNYNNNNTYPTVVQVLARSTQSLKTIKENGSNGAPCNGSGLFGTTGNISQKEEEAHMNDENHLQITVRRSARIRTTSECSQGSCRKRAHTMGAKDLGVRPLYRDDIFFSASLLRLPQYKSQVSSVGYHLSVSRLPSKKDVEEEENPRCTVCPEAIKRTLTTMLDLSLLRSPTFLLLSISGFITIMGLYVPFIYLTDMAKLNGLPAPTAIWLISAIGVANTIGRVACGVVSSIPGTDVILMNNVALTIGGFMTMFATLSTNPIFLFTYCTIFGLSIACFASLRSIIIVEMMGLPKLTNAFGLMLMFQGVAAMIGSPLAGMVLEATGSYDWSFYLAGGLIAISGIICFPMKRLKAWEVQQEKKLRQQNIAV